MDKSRLMQDASQASIITQQPLILASDSASRKTILTRTGLQFSVEVSDIDESVLKQQLQHKSVEEQALQLSIAKAAAVGVCHPESWVIGADQMCVGDNIIYDKPGNFARAKQQLLALSGTCHQQYSAVCLFHQGELRWSTVECVNLQMHALTEEDITSYLLLDQPFLCCGAYQFESLGCHLFASVDGPSDTIEGLALLPLLKALREYGVYSLHIDSVGQ